MKPIVCKEVSCTLYGISASVKFCKEPATGVGAGAPPVPNSAAVEVAGEEDDDEIEGTEGVMSVWVDPGERGEEEGIACFCFASPPERMVSFSFSEGEGSEGATEALSAAEESDGPEVEHSLVLMTIKSHHKREPKGILSWSANRKTAWNRFFCPVSSSKPSSSARSPATLETEGEEETELAGRSSCPLLAGEDGGVGLGTLMTAETSTVSPGWAKGTSYSSSALICLCPPKKMSRVPSGQGTLPWFFTSQVLIRVCPCITTERPGSESSFRNLYSVWNKTENKK